VTSILPPRTPTGSSTSTFSDDGVNPCGAGTVSVWMPRSPYNANASSEPIATRLRVGESASWPPSPGSAVAAGKTASGAMATTARVRTTRVRAYLPAIVTIAIVCLNRCWQRPIDEDGSYPCREFPAEDLGQAMLALAGSRRRTQLRARRRKGPPIPWFWGTLRLLAVSGCYLARSRTSTRRHRLVADSGRVSISDTRSPTPAVPFSSCTFTLVVVRMILP
jgi:hypothetical protein